MVAADHRTVEQAPRALDGVGVNVAPDPFVRGVVHARRGDLPGVGVADPPVGLVGVGVDRFGSPVHGLPQEAVDRRVVGALDDPNSELVAIAAKDGLEFESEEASLKSGLKSGAVAVAVGGRVVLPGRRNPRTKPHSNWGCGL